MSDRKPSREANRFDKIFKENLEDLILPMLRLYAGLEIKSLYTTTSRTLAEVCNFGFLF